MQFTAVYYTESNAYDIVYELASISVNDVLRLGRHVKVANSHIMVLIENNHSYTVRKIYNILKIFKSYIINYLHWLEYVSRFDEWLPHKLITIKKNCDYISVFD